MLRHLPLWIFSTFLIAHLSIMQIRYRLDNLESIFERFPDFQKAYDERIEVDIHAGEALYIPPFVWHYVETDELCNFLYISKVLCFANLTCESPS
jgi:hypothetical protein